MAEIPVERCIGGRELTEPRLSPSGRRIGYIVSVAGSASLVVRELGPDDAGDARSHGDPVDELHVLDTVPAPRGGRGLGGGCWTWVPSEAAVVHAAVDGNLWFLDLSGVSRPLTDHGPERVAQAPVVSPDGRFVVYVLDQSEVRALRLDAQGGSTASLRLDDGTADFCFDPWVDGDSRRVQWLGWNVPDMPWDAAEVHAVDIVPTEDSGLEVMERVPRRPSSGGHDPSDTGTSPRASVQQPRTLPDGRMVWLRDDRGWLNLWIDDEPLVEEPSEHGGPTWGLGQRSFAADHDGRRVAFTRNERGFGRLCVVDVATGLVHEVARGVHGQLSWVGGRLAAIRTGARTPTQVVVHDTRTSDPTSWPVAVVDVGPSPEWNRNELVEPEAVTVVAPDGTELHARLHRADEPDGRLIVWFHGGPTDQWQVTFMPRLAWWRAQGWSILVPDHRGSTGHGRAYQQALRHRWGELDVSDAAAIVDAAHARAWGMPGGTALMGGSAGGFTVLGLLAARPDLAAAAAVAYPVADLADLADRSHRFERHYTLSLVGPVPPMLERVAGHPYVDRSPVWFADRIRTPLLVFHGSDDPVVPLDQSRVLVERIRAAGSQADLVVYPGEGHGFRLPEHQLDEYRRTADFLRDHVV